MTTQAASTIPARVDVDPDGDVVLDVGKRKDRILIRASSSVLSLTSEPFAALLIDPNIKENQLANSKESPKVIPMKDDPPQIMLTLCNITHYRYWDVKPPTGDELIALTLLCDKYVCTDAISMWVKCHLHQHFPFDNYYIASADLEKLGLSLAETVALAYIYNDHRVLMDASRSLALRTESNLTKPEKMDLDQQLSWLLPMRFLESLESKRREYINAASNKIWSTIAAASAKYRDCDCGKDEIENKSRRTSRATRDVCDQFEGCMSSMLQAGFYLDCLHHSNNILLQTPLNKPTPPKTSACAILKEIAAIAEIRWDYRGSRDCGGLQSTTALNNKLLNLINEMPKKLRGLCLNASKHDDQSPSTSCDCLELEK